MNAQATLPMPPNDPPIDTPPTESASKRRRRVLPAFCLILAVAALGVAGYAIVRSNEQVSDLQSSIRSLNSSVSSLDRSVSDLEYGLSSLESRVADLENEMPNDLSSELATVQSDLTTLEEQVCGIYCSGYSYGGVAGDVDDLRNCVNEFIDAWANNGSTYLC